MKKYNREILKEEYFTELKTSLSEYYNYMFWEDMDDFDHYHDCGDPNCWCYIDYEYISIDRTKSWLNSGNPIDMESFRSKVWKRNKKIDDILNIELDEN